MRILLLVVLLALWPGAARAQSTASRSPIEVAEITSACLDREIGDRVIGGTWVEATDSSHPRVAMTMRYPPPWQGDVFAWIDIERTAAGRATPLAPPYVYVMPTRDYEYRAAHGGYRDEALAEYGQWCFTRAVYSR